MRRTCRLVVCELEGRLLLAGSEALPNGATSLLRSFELAESAGTRARWISTTPVPGDSPRPMGVPLAAWLKVHQKFMGQVKRYRPDVVFLGDSMTEGWVGAGSRVWNSQIAPLRAAAFGIHGDQTQHVLWRVLNGELSGRPKVAVVLVGFNNLALRQGPEETAAGIGAVVKAIRTVSPGTKVLLLGVLPCGPKPGTVARAEIAQVNASISRLADDSVTYLDVGRRFLQPDGTISPFVMTGYVHPTQAGYQILAGAIREPLRRLLGR